MPKRTLLIMTIEPTGSDLTQRLLASVPCAGSGCAAMDHESGLGQPPQAATGLPPVSLGIRDARLLVGCTGGVPPPSSLRHNLMVFALLELGWEF